MAPKPPADTAEPKAQSRTASPQATGSATQPEQQPRGQSHTQPDAPSVGASSGAAAQHQTGEETEHPASPSLEGAWDDSNVDKRPRGKGKETAHGAIRKAKLDEAWEHLQWDHISEAPPLSARLKGGFTGEGVNRSLGRGVPQVLTTFSREINYLYNAIKTPMVMRTKEGDIYGYKPSDTLYLRFIQAIQSKIDIATHSLASAGKKARSLSIPQWGVENDVDLFVMEHDYEIQALGLIAQTEHLLATLDKYHDWETGAPRRMDPDNETAMLQNRVEDYYTGSYRITPPAQHFPAVSTSRTT
ncbi:hypothetical protein BDZ89DRAFT_1148465 [Hymenopellis radicata]|nr:hypothetical protein BDZ89DRAFT_1148465 [Hymenopellis radicata]